MLRIHLAQLLYNAAYYDPPVDHLEEPCRLGETDTAVGSVRHISRVQGLLDDAKGSYIEHLREKLTAIINWSGTRKAQLLAFPEYSVPLQLLPEIGGLAKYHGMTIVAGSHRVPSGDESRALYDRLGLHPQRAPLGSACAPIVLPDGSVIAVTKLKKSKREPNLNVPKDDPRVITVNYPTMSIRISVILCIDSLDTELIGRLWAKDQSGPQLIICPSLSPPTELFHSIGSMLVSKEVVFAYVNAAHLGGTFFNLPMAWHPYLKGHRNYLENVPPNVEAVLEMDVDPSLFFDKRGSLETTPVCGYPVYVPIVYTKGAAWLAGFDRLRSDIGEWLKVPEPTSAIDWLDSYLTEEAVALPDLLRQNLRCLRHSVLPLYDGNPDSVDSALETIRMPSSVDDTRIFWAERVGRAIDILTDCFKECTVQSSDDLLKCLKSLKSVQQTLPPDPMAYARARKPAPTPQSDSPVFVGEDNLMEAFQNRGHDLDTIRNYFANSENRVILITGSMGIGKTDFVNWMFRKQFGDWEPIRIPIPIGGRFSRVLADVAFKLGIPMDVDSLGTVSHDVLRGKIRKMMNVFYSRANRALILDDLHNILQEGNARDHRQLATFVEEAAAPESFSGGRVFLVSSQWLPEKWVRARGALHLRMKGVVDLYARRIIEFHMRRLRLVADGSIPEPPQALLDVVKGHPLSARLLAEALRETDLGRLSEELTVQNITGHIARDLLERVCLTPDETLVMQQISIFRLPVRIDILREIQESREYEKTITGLTSRCILSYDGQSIEMHEAVRRFFENGISSDQQREMFHRTATAYYQKIYDRRRPLLQNDPNIAGELIHHMALVGDIGKARDLRLLVVEEIKPAARQLYREYRDYARALELYRLAANLTPDDPIVLAYVGRCFARVGQWKDSDRAFQQAIDMAVRTGLAIWWIYRDWGHIRARYEFYDDARRLFDKASSMNPNDPSIKATLAYMYWRQGENQMAQDFFEKALKLDPNHQYTLTFYPKFLDAVGEHGYADELRQRLASLSADEVEYRLPREHDLEVEDYDES